MSWLVDLLGWLIPNAVIEAIGSRRRGKFDHDHYGEARFDSKTGKQIK